MLKKTNALGDNPTFIRLVQLIQSDQGTRDLFLKILKMDPFTRSGFIGDRIKAMKTERAPEEHIKAMEALSEPAVCQKLAELMDKAP